MPKLKMKKSKSLVSPNPVDGPQGAAMISRCQIEIPGMGRIRTGGPHLDFHLVQGVVGKIIDRPTRKVQKNAVGVE